MKPTFDERDAELLKARQNAWDQIPGPRVGDFCHMPDGSLRRFAHDWGDLIQITMHQGGGSFYLGDGYVSYSGSLASPIPKSALESTHSTRPGRFWFFHHNDWTAHNGVGVDATIPCRVYKVVG